MISRIALSQRSRLVGVVNHALPALYASRALSRPQLHSDAILDQVTAEAGLDDFGGDWFRQPLDVLIDALRNEASLNRLGLFAAVGQLKKVLKDRLHAEALFAENPEIGARRLRSPVIVVGPMRSGTTRLHRLLAADARFAHMRSFETVNPVPAPGFRPGDTDRRWIPARLALGAVHTFNPTTACIHPTGPFEPEEELGLLVRSIWGMKHEAQWHIRAMDAGARRRMPPRHMNIWRGFCDWWAGRAVRMIGGHGCSRLRNICLICQRCCACFPMRG